MLDDVVSGMGYYKNIFFFFFSLATVQSFRAEVLRKASSNVFEQLSKQDKQIVYRVIAVQQQLSHCSAISWREQVNWQ